MTPSPSEVKHKTDKMEKEELLAVLEHISKHYFEKKDYVSAGQINRAMDVVEDYDGDIAIILETKNK